MPGKMDDLLEECGVPSHIERDGEISQLEQYLDQNRGIVVGVDSSEVWSAMDAEGRDDDARDTGRGSDHAILITEIDEASGTVTLNDPGHPKGAGSVIPLDDFQDAWKDSGNVMAVTEGLPSSTTPAGDPGTPGETPGAEQSPVVEQAPAATALSSDVVGDGEGASLAEGAARASMSGGAVILPIVLSAALVARGFHRAREATRKPKQETA